MAQQTKSAPKNTKQEARPPAGVERARNRTVYQPSVDIIETQDAVMVLAEMPGVDESETDVTLEKNVLTIQGTVRPVEIEGFSPVYAEYGIGDYERSFKLSDEIDRDGIEATVRDGVLRLILPKVKEAMPQKIAVAAG